MKLISCKIMFAIIVLLIGAGCALKPATNSIQLSNHITYTLSEPPSDLISTTHTHLIEATFDGKVQRLLAQIEFQHEQISLAAMSPAGVPLFDFVWRKGHTVEINQYVPLPNLDISYIIADVQWVTWPIDSLIASTSGKHTTVTQNLLPQKKEAGLGNKPGVNNWVRKVKYKNRDVLTIQKNSNQYFLQHELRNYRIKITDVSKDKK